MCGLFSIVLGLAFGWACLPGPSQIHPERYAANRPEVVFGSGGILNGTDIDHRFQVKGGQEGCVSLDLGTLLPPANPLCTKSAGPPSRPSSSLAAKGQNSRPSSENKRGAPSIQIFILLFMRFR